VAAPQALVVWREEAARAADVDVGLKRGQN
jgi:hypothetical protein